MQPSLKDFNSHQGKEDENEDGKKKKVVERKDGPR